MVMTEPVLIVSVEPIYDVDDENLIFTQRFAGRSRLVIEGEDAIVAVLHEQAVAAAEHLRELVDA